MLSWSPKIYYRLAHFTVEKKEDKDKEKEHKNEIFVQLFTKNVQQNC